MSRIKGYPIAFNVQSCDLGNFYEVIRSSAVDRLLSERDNVAALVNHNADRPLARSTTGTLKCDKDAFGLAVDITVDDEISYVSGVVRGSERHGASRSTRHARQRSQRRSYVSGLRKNAILRRPSVDTAHSDGSHHGQQSRRGQRQPCL